MIFRELSNTSLVPEPLSEVSVYVHIPFCKTRCHYCAFYLETGFSPRVLRETLHGVLAEAHTWAQLLGYPKVRSIYVGGGTPSVIPPDTLHGFLTELRRALRVSGTGKPGEFTPAEFTIEMNPESVTAELLSIVEACGVDRVSLGVQSLRDRELAILGRRSNAARAREALSLTARHWSHRFSADLMIGIPEQQPDGVRRLVRELIDYGVDHISCYGLTVEPQTALEQAVLNGGLRMPGRDSHEKLWHAAASTMETAGMRCYEVSNYAFPGHESLHNQGYWRLDPYVGLGPGAVSTLPVTQEGIRRVARLTGGNVFTYQSVRRGYLEHALEVLTSRDFLFEHFMNGLRTTEGVPMERIRNRFSLDSRSIISHFRNAWSGYHWRDKRYNPSNRLVLTREARETLDHMLPSLLQAIESWISPDELSITWPESDQ